MNFTGKKHKAIDKMKKKEELAVHNDHNYFSEYQIFYQLGLNKL